MTNEHPAATDPRPDRVYSTTSSSGSTRMTKAVISTIGRDRPGIVDDLTRSISNHGLNIEDSRMAVLGGEFAVLMTVSGDSDALTELEHELAAMAEAADFAYLFRRTEARVASQSLPYRVHVVAMDHPGIVHGVARFFSARQINIRELETDAVHAPHTGTPLFNLQMTIEVPAGTRIRQLRSEFEAFCDDQDLDGSVEAG
jgi:glycine cleavage system transcriptional repressor